MVNEGPMHNVKDYIVQCRNSGHPDSKIMQNLSSSNWPEDIIQIALSEADKIVPKNSEFEEQPVNELNNEVNINEQVNKKINDVNDNNNQIGQKNNNTSISIKESIKQRKEKIQKSEQIEQDPKNINQKK